ncbi:AMP-binding protein [Nonomuraea phyllanthi]|uniref:AMP-binding protein n=1 Tax=Nonomuraea phyllanthi TaxID=2219224 RepID=A0A5C4WH88_9ACTN|nr:AMP-binding protein [Nonomuraea phyllanthi]KAB8193589.1 AMP-binding protein [Nonomuraea phyllanthi]QFY12330.1 AMP-binding protein [Nonomuraea phyllanthi]
MTWTELVLAAVPTRGDQPAVTDIRTGEVLTYAAFAKRVTRAALGLLRQGLRFGDRVIVNVPLGAKLPVAVHAVAWAGGTAVLAASGQARFMITQRHYDPAAVKVEQVFSFEPAPGAKPFHELIGERGVEFGPLAGSAITFNGRTFDHDTLANDLRKIASRLVIGKDDVVISAVSEPFRGLRLIDLAMTAGAHVVVAHGPSLVGCRVLAAERRATMVVAPYDLAKRLLGDPVLRVVDERAIVSSLAL